VVLAFGDGAPRVEVHGADGSVTTHGGRTLDAETTARVLARDGGVLAVRAQLPLTDLTLD